MLGVRVGARAHSPACACSAVARRMVFDLADTACACSAVACRMVFDLADTDALPIDMLVAEAGSGAAAAAAGSATASAK